MQIKINCQTQMFMTVNIISVNNINSKMLATKERRAIPFIIKNQKTNYYELTKQAEDVLRKVDKNISVVSVAGLYRTGKSYLLNSVILDKKSVFGVGPTVNPCTKGLWLWVEPDPISEKRSMIVIDTEGLGALDQQANHDMKIFCLAVLLSTTFIYNSVGSIDENALQTLSLVLNLVNNIDQDNTSSRPQFIWVVRDFSLQLIDDKGKIITPQQYLQMALTSNTKQQQKANIRKTITSAFSQRDCFTLVKPLIDETKLQNLDMIPMDQLRPQFVSQSIELRNKIKSTLRQFKLTSGHNNITGKQYIMVVQKYLAAINSGAVPNMIDTWTFIREEKCRQALQEIAKIYTDKIKSRIISKIPMKKSALDQQFKLMKSEIKTMYLKMTYDETSTEPVEEFVNNIYNQAIKINAEQNRHHIKAVLTKQFEPYLKKLFSQYYNNFEEFQAEITKGYRDTLIEKFNDKIDDIKDHVDRYVDQKLIQNFKFFQKKLKEDVKNMKNLKEELELSLSRQVSQISTIKEKQRRAHQQKIFELEKKIRMFQNQKQQIIEFGKAQKDLIEGNLSLLKKKNQELQGTNQQLNKEIGQLHTTQNQLKQKHFMQHKENQKQRALFSQKEEYMNTKIRELQAKCIELQTKANEAGGRLQNQKKGMIKHYQQKIQTLQMENKRLSEKLMQSQLKLSKILDEAKQMSDQIHILKQNNVSEKKKLEQKLIEAESHKKPSKFEHELKMQNQELANQLHRTNEKLNEAGRKLKLMQQQSKNIHNNYQKQIAIHVQQIQFQQIQINDLKGRYDQLKKSYQNTLQNLHDSSKNNESNMQLKIYQLTAEHQRQIKNIEQQHDEKVKSLKKQIQMLTRHKQQMTLQQSLDRKNLQSKQKQWKESTSMLQLMVKKLQDKLQSSEKDHEDINKQKQSFYSLRIKQLQQQIQEVKDRASQEISENSKKSQEAFSVLKHYSEIQKQQWEKRLIDEKDKSQKRVKLLRDQLEKKINEERANFEEEISELQNRLVHMERVFNEKLQNMQYDHDISMQKVTNQFMQQKVQLNKDLALTQQKLDMTKATFERQLSNKIKYYETTLQNTKATLKQEYDEIVKRTTEEKQALEQKLDTLKKSNRQLQQSNLILKNQVDKQKAIHRQKEKSLQKKLTQLQNRLQSQLLTYNKTIETINERHIVELEKLNQQIDKLNLKVSNLQEERDRLETEHQSNINRLQAKLKVVQESKNKNKQDYEDIVNKFQCAVAHLGKQNKKIINEREKGMEEVNQKANQLARKLEEGHKKMMKQNQDRIARLVTQNKSLKERLMVIQLERSTSANKKNYLDQSEKEKLDRKYQKRIQEYKELYDREKQKSKKLKDENTKLRMEMQSSSFVQGNSTITYVERPSFSEISNSRLYNGVSTNMGNGTEVKRKYTNPPASTIQRGREGGLDQYSGFVRFNPGTGYKNRD